MPGVADRQAQRQAQHDPDLRSRQVRLGSTYSQYNLRPLMKARLSPSATATQT